MDHYESILRFKDCGFPFIKVELEATVNPNELAMDHDGDDSSDRIVGYLESVHLNIERILHEVCPTLEFKYSNVYYDHAADTEWTFTISVDDIGQLPNCVEAFTQACSMFGRNPKIDLEATRECGVHITLLPESDYPLPPHWLPQDKINNYCNQVEKILLALAFTGSQRDSTRSFHFRELIASHTRKYSAIYTHGGSCIEYRIFDTNYDQPEKILENVNNIARTLKYYESKQVVPLRSDDKSISNVNNTNRTGYVKLSRLFIDDATRKRLMRELGILYMDEEVPEEEIVRLLGDKITDAPFRPLRKNEVVKLFELKSSGVSDDEVIKDITNDYNNYLREAFRYNRQIGVEGRKKQARSTFQQHIMMKNLVMKKWKLSAEVIQQLDLSQIDFLCQTDDFNPKLLTDSTIKGWTTKKKSEVATPREVMISYDSHLRQILSEPPLLHNSITPRPSYDHGDIGLDYEVGSMIEDTVTTDDTRAAVGSLRSSQ